MIKSYLKTLWRTFAKHKTRFVSLICMVLVSAGFISGLGTATDKMNYSLSDYYKSQTVSDFIIKSKSPLGFTFGELEEVNLLFEGATVNTGNSIDLPVGEMRSLRLYFIDYNGWTVNIPEITAGEKPASASECFAEIADNVIKGYSVGERVLEEYGLNVTVSGIVQSPLTFARGGEPSYNNPEDAEFDNSTSGTDDMDCLENILYLSCELAPYFGVSACGDIYVALKDRSVFNCFSGSYKNLIAKGEKAIYDELGKDNVSVITLYKNYSFNSLYYYSDKVQLIGYILMIAFLFVTALVVLSTMTRFIEEERAQTGCLKTLGYSSTAIISKYLIFALIATGIGAFISYFVGLGLAFLLYTVFNYSFNMPPMSGHVAMVFYIITITVIIGATLFATAFAGYKMTGENPAELLRPKPPRAGRTVLLEKIPFIWNRLSFKYKSTLRNVLRYKSRFIMTVVSVAVSTALVLTGLALLDLCLFHDFGSPAIMGVAIVIVIFAGLLTAVVIYTLTNINISERTREIATLMVLGYHDGEVTGYVYREIFINSLVGILFGYPAAALLIHFVFGIMAQGTLAGISWFMWLVAPFIVIAFTGLVTLLLRRKIVKINMNESLKANE